MMREIFSGPEGLSSTRILGALGWASGITMAACGMTSESTTVLTASTALLGAGQIRGAIRKGNTKIKETDK